MTVFMESFHTVDSSTPGPNLSWTEMVSDLTMVSGRLRAVTSATFAAARAEADCGSVDHRVMCVIRALNTAASGISNGIRIRLRYAAGADTCYEVHARKNTSGQGRWEIFRTVAGSTTGLAASADGAVTWSAGDTLEGEVSGIGATVTIVVKKNGVTLGSFGDTDAARLTTGTRGGVGLRYNTNQGDVECDNWQISPLAVVSTGAAIGISGKQFTYNGVPAFLFGASYFSVKGWDSADLDDFQALGYRLLRIGLDTTGASSPTSTCWAWARRRWPRGPGKPRRRTRRRPSRRGPISATT